MSCGCITTWRKYHLFARLLLGILQNKCLGKAKLVINKRGTPKIQAGKYGRQCPASNSGCCCHVMVIIWKLENMTRNSEVQNSTPDNRGCTSKPRQWGKGNKREVEFHPVMASTLVKPRHASDQSARNIRGIQSQFYDPLNS